MEMAGSSNAPDVSTPTHDMKFMQASNINVSNFVSLKLSGRSNYKIWQAQMLCLIESQVLLHIVNDQHPFPVDKGVHMISQYDKLVKGWIFGSVKENVLKDLVDLGTAQEVWMKLESLFNLPVSDTEDDSSHARVVSALEVIAPVISAIREDLKYLQASNVNVSNFVTEKLSGESNYDTWKTEMLFLIGSHELLHIIHAQFRFPEDGDPMTQKYDNLVKGWILSTLNHQVRHEFRIYRSVQLMWRNLESTFTYQPDTDDTDTEDTEVDSPNEKEDLKYTQASNANVSKFVSVKLSGQSSYSTWKAQILRLLESYDLLYLLHDNQLVEDKYDKLVRDWIFSTLDASQQFEDGERLYGPVYYLWRKLEDRFRDGVSWPDYTQESIVNVSNFISVKLSGKSNYPIWKVQMICLLKIQNLLHVIQSLSTADKSNTIVKGWILGTMSEQLVKDVIYTENLLEDKFSASDVWDKLEQLFEVGDINREGDTKGIVFEVGDSNREDTLGIVFIKEAPDRETQNNPDIETESSRRLAETHDTMDIETHGTMDIETHGTTDIGTESSLRVRETKDTANNRLKKELYEAAFEGWWRNAKSILKTNEIAATEAVTANGNTILHVAVEMGHNYFVEKLLEFLADGKDIETQNHKGRTALHIAAIVGNTHTAQLLVKKRKQLLDFKDHNNRSPLHLASANANLDTYAYLFKSSTRPFDSDIRSHISNKSALLATIFSKQYDLAETLLKESPTIARYNNVILKAITISFPTGLGFTESFIYPSFHYVRQKTIVRGSLLFHPDICVNDILRVVNICNNTCCSLLGKNSMILFVLIATLYPIYQLISLLILMLHLSLSMLYLVLWKVLAVTVRPIKNIEKKRKEYEKAKYILSLICKLMGPTNDGYSDSFFEAVRQDRYEVVDEILINSPDTINLKDADGYNIIQLSIMNRAEKVYNLIYHIIQRTKYRREMTDSYDNNLAHLAGRLAPSFVLGRTTGAALQLQRELLWFEEVEKLVLPLKLEEKNIHKETPAMVFTREHQDLLKQGEIWLKKTAESCSITAALIVTVVFAAAITVPGGSNQESGIPLFEKEIFFTIFAASNALSLFTGSTALLLFLSILTARSSEKDFRVILPRRLIFGLLTLFLSTISMLVAFGAILFLVFCEKRPWMLAPICVSACLPILVIVTIKLPLLVDLIQSTYSPIIGKKSYLESCHVNRKNTIFTN
ncbi:putative ankyrin repeat-containing domain, PGG domain, ankyrin repeat-containing domain superfamily [Helianthus annuus]|nr:putative ankyrin repeat-containing domain, PGG domain, ankyrin repeat-containing domain superfamily [Helianthus annuus]